MTSDEIRAIPAMGKHNAQLGLPDSTSLFLREIAAQLAELNEWLKTPQHIKDMQEAQIRGR